MRYLISCFLLMFLVEGCVDRIDFAVGELNSGIIVVNGVITNEPGPYTITVFRASNIDDVLNRAQPAAVKVLEIINDLGEREQLENKGEGLFETSSSGIKGQVGLSYHIRMEMPDGAIFESTPEELKPVTDIDSMYFMWESTPQLNGPPRVGFRVFMDTRGGEDEENFLRWRYKGTYMALSYPELRRERDICTLLYPPQPPPCSGYVWDGNRLFSDDEVPCTCCICWVDDNEDKPQLSDDRIVTNGTFKNVEVGYVPFNEFTFAYGKYLLTVEQMSLSKDAFDFWKIIKDQKEGATSLFQPSFGKIRTNISSVNSQSE